jgi:hypothetical protein
MPAMPPPFPRTRPSRRQDTLPNHPGPQRRTPRNRQAAMLLIALVMASLASGCGLGAANAAPDAAAHQPSPLGAEVIDTFLPATGAQNSAGLKFNATETALRNRILARCMNRQSFGAREQPYLRWDERYLNQLSPWVPGWDGRDVSGVVLYNIPLLARGGLLGEILTGAPPPPKLPTAEEGAIDTADARCQNSASTAFQKLRTAGVELEQPWLREVNGIRGSASVQAALHGFTTCAAGHGAPAAAAKSPATFDAWLSELVQPTVTQVSAIRTPIATRVAEDRHWTEVFVTCATAPASLEDRLQLRQQRSFLQAHREQLLALESLASRVLSTLERQYGLKSG